jgi:error-prone DNA polymerase
MLHLGFRQIDGFRKEWADKLVAERDISYPAVEELLHKARLSLRALKLLADADAFRSIGLDRRNALWAVRRLPDENQLPLFAVVAAPELSDEADTGLPVMPLPEHVVADYQTVRLSLKGHPLQFLRELLSAEGVRSCADSVALSDGMRTKTAGIVLVRQRPGSAAGVVFMTIEDETGIINVVVWPKLTERYRKEVMGARLILIEGCIQRSPEGIVHLVAQRLYDRSRELSLLSVTTIPKLPLSRADEIIRPQHERESNHPRNERSIPKSRDFH